MSFVTVTGVKTSSLFSRLNNRHLKHFIVKAYVTVSSAVTQS